MMFALNDVRIIVGMLMGAEIPAEDFELNEINMSAICEVMNQMMGSSATALSEFFGYAVNISTPVSFPVESEEWFKAVSYTHLQRIGIFAGSGVGKSTLMGMIAKNVKADINVIALVGERGREVLEFVQKDLGEEGMNRSVLVVATSDQPAMLRMKCPLVARCV